MTGWSPDPYGNGPVDPYAGRAAQVPPSGDAYNNPYRSAPVPPGQPYPQPGSWEFAQYAPKQGPPGLVAASAILSFVAAALLLLASLLLFLGASIVSGLSTSEDVGYSSAEFTFTGIGNVLAAAALIVGGVVFLLRNSLGRYLLSGGAALTVALAIYWLARVGVPSAIFWAMLFLALTVTAAALAWQRAATTWLAAGVGPSLPTASAAPYPGPFGS